MGNKPELTTIQKLDHVLEWFAKNPNGGSYELIRSGVAIGEKYVSFDDSKRIVEKFTEEGFVYKNQFYGQSLYTISFDGMLFYENGGYAEKQRTEDIRIKYLETAEKLRMTNEDRMVKGTWAVAIGAIGLIVWEIYKTFCLERH